MLKAYPDIQQRVEMPVPGMAANATAVAPTLYVNGTATAASVTANTATAGRLVVTHAMTGRTPGEVLTYLGGTVTVNAVAYPVVIDPHVVDVLDYTRMPADTLRLPAPGPGDPGGLPVIDFNGRLQSSVVDFGVVNEDFVPEYYSPTLFFDTFGVRLNSATLAGCSESRELAD